MYTVTMKFHRGPTILEQDSEVITLIRVTHNPVDLANLQAAAIKLGMLAYQVEESE